MALSDRYAVQYAPIDAASSGANEVIAAVSGKRIVVLAWTLVAASAVTAQWKSGTTARTGVMSFAGNGGASVDSESGVMATVAGQALNLTLGGAVQASGHVTYVLTG